MNNCICNQVEMYQHCKLHLYNVSVYSKCSRVTQVCIVPLVGAYRAVKIHKFVLFLR